MKDWRRNVAWFHGEMARGPRMQFDAPLAQHTVATVATHLFWAETAVAIAMRIDKTRQRTDEPVIEPPRRWRGLTYPTPVRFNAARMAAPASATSAASVISRRRTAAGP